MTNPRHADLDATPWNDPHAEPSIRIVNVTKKFGEFIAVNNVSLDVYKGELFCLLGASGCGKTTLLRMLAGFERPSEGAILIDGVDVSEIPPYKRPFNMMFQSYALFPHMTVAQNVAFGLKQESVPRAEIRDRVSAILDLVELGPFAKRKPHQLSGGQRQRVALARSLVKQPKLLLLDEPLAALDKKLREQTQFELVNIQETLGVTFIVVTHDQQEAMTLASRIGVMDKGQIVQVGQPADVYEFPNCRFVADFIGSVNLFEGKVVEDEPDYVRIHSEEAGCVFYIDHGIASATDARVWVAVRPEKIAILREQPDTESNWTKGVVDEIAYMGNLSVFHVRLATGKLVRVVLPNLTRRADDRITWDDEVYLHWLSSSGVVLTS
ncbi:MAG: ABC transporter ATP-binding protein [Alphaproteobacteria bacterium]